jgi:hypothetical protein
MVEDMAVECTVEEVECTAEVEECMAEVCTAEVEECMAVVWEVCTVEGTVVVCMVKTEVDYSKTHSHI